MLNILSSFVAQLSTYGPLNEGDTAAVCALPVTVQTYVSDTHVVRQGDLGRSFLVLKEGFAIREKLTGDGARQFLSLDIPGDPLNLPALFLSIADHGVIALANAKIAFIPRQPVLDLVTVSSSIKHAFLKLALTDGSIAREKQLNLGRRNARVRVAHFLCEHVARMEARGLLSGNAFRLPLTQEQVGDATGLTSVHVNRMLGKLAAENLIIQNGRSIIIPSITALREAGDFNTQYLFI